MQPLYKDHFVVQGDVAWFTRDKHGKVNAMHVGASRTELITSTKAMILIILSLVVALIARYPFAVAAARSPL
jgi:hypothetical protein